MSKLDFVEQDFIARQETLLNRTSSLGLKYILVFGYGSALGAGSKSHGAMRYLTDWDSHEASSLLILSKNDKLLLLSSPFMVPAAQQKYSMTTIVYMPPTKWAEFLSLKFGQNSAVGIIGFDEMPISVYRPLTPLVEGPDSIDLEHYLSMMRVIKDESEVALHKKGAAICDEIFLFLKEAFNNGKAVWEIQLALETRARYLGADYCKTWLTVRPFADYPRYWPEEGEYEPQQGDQILFGIALSVSGHWAHGIRMGSVGPATKDHKLLWGLVMDMLARGADCLSLDNGLNSCELMMDEILEQYKSENKISVIKHFRNGHGLGTSYEEPLTTEYFPQHFGSDLPSKTKLTELMVKPSMLFELHPNIFIPDVGGAAIGEMLLTTKDGVESLLKFPTELFELK